MVIMPNMMHSIISFNLYQTHRGLSIHQQTAKQSRNTTGEYCDEKYSYL